MRIQNNIMAMNTHRSYTINNNAVSKSAEKLSSGYRINRAGDDAAGLAISEKMRREIRGLSMASKNAQDGVSMVQTAEGALTEVHSMLQRMSELAVQAASDSNDTAVDRPALDAEFQQLIAEIDQISQTTTFNDMNLLDGSFTGKQIQVGSNSGVTLQIDIESMSASALGLGGASAVTGGSAVTGSSGTANVAKINVTLPSGSSGTTAAASIDIDLKDGSNVAVTPATGDSIQITSTGGTTDLDLTASYDGSAWTVTGAPSGWTATFDGSSLSLTQTTAAATGANFAAEFGTLSVGTVSGNVNATNSTATAGSSFTQGVAGSAYSASAGDSFTVTSTGGTTNLALTVSYDGSAWSVTGAPQGYTATFDGTAITLTQGTAAATGANFAAEFGTLSVGTTNGGATGTTVAAGDYTQGVAAGANNNNNNNTATGAVNVLTREAASSAIDSVKAAIKTVSDQRAALGAVQNRLEHKIANLDNTVENVSAAESRIRDVDIAKEMTNFTKQNILAQAATAMLAQANAAPQNVLSLLQ